MLRFLKILYFFYFLNLVLTLKATVRYGLITFNEAKKTLH